MGAASTVTEPDLIQAFLENAMAKFQAFQSQGLIIVNELDKDIVVLLGVAKQDMPAILGVVNTVATLASIFIPGAAVVPFLADVAKVVQTVDTYVVTADGIVADPSVALTVASAASAIQKQQAATAQVSSAYPQVHPAVTAAHVAIATAALATKAKS